MAQQDESLPTGSQNQNQANSFLAQAQVEQQTYPESPVIPHSGNLPQEMRELPVEEFDNTSLGEATETGLIVTPESPAGLTDTPPTPANQIEKKRVSTGTKIGLGIGAGLLTIGSAAVAAKAILGTDGDIASKNEPVASGPQIPGKPEGQQSNLPISLENVYMKPPAELIAEVKKPITVTDYPTPELAIPRLGEYWKMLLISGTAADGPEKIEETAASQSEREQIESSFLSDDFMANQNVANAEILRSNIAVGLFYANEYSVEADPKDPAFFTTAWLPQEIKETAMDGYLADVKVTFDTNLFTKWPTSQQLFHDLEPHTVMNLQVYIGKRQGEWKILGFGNSTIEETSVDPVSPIK